jgi:aarF domain-containing kinase
MPEAWVDRLSELQDALPARKFSDVEQTLKDAFPGGWPFQSVEELPLATASIAQVHKAELLDGQQVVVKVQHRGIEELILQDLENVMYLAEWLAKEKPEHDYRELLQEWCDETRKETDFQHEAYNLERVAANLKSLSGVRLPKLIRQVKGVGTIAPSREVLVMEFIDGVKPTDTASLREIGVDGDALIERISAAFANQIFVDGLFNGDPHPGNILVERSTRMPILLDFGFVKEVPEKIRIAFCRLLVSAAEQDFVGLLAAMRDMGLGEQVSLARPTEAMNFVRYAFRDATPTAEQQKRGSSARDDIEDEDWDLIEEEAAGVFGTSGQDR